MPWGFNFNNMNNNQNNNNLWYNGQRGYGQNNNQYQQVPNYRNNQMGFMFGNNMHNNNQMQYFNNMQGQNPNLPMQNGMNMFNQNGQMGNKKQAFPVSYEPLDEKTLKEIQMGLEKNKQGDKQGTNNQEEKFAFSGQDNNKILDDLSLFVQNERNSSLFYKYLSDICIKNSYRNILQNISEDSLKQSHKFNEIYKSISGNEYTVKDTPINNIATFSNGIQLAIEEESKALDSLTDVFEKINDERYKNKITSLIYKKISRINFLNLMNNRI